MADAVDIIGERGSGTLPWLLVKIVTEELGVNLRNGVAREVK